MKNITHHFKLYKYLYIVAIVGILGGIFLTLSVDAIRYTQYVEPHMVEMEPTVAYQEMLANPKGYLFLDVRTPAEYESAHASSSVNVPIAQLFDLWKTLPRTDDKKIYLICTSGRLAGVAYGYLQLHGFRNIVHIQGGIQNWISEGMPIISKPLFTDPKQTWEGTETSPCLAPTPTLE
jgi:rhodanese-related sulfurtransferase